MASFWDFCQRYSGTQEGQAQAWRDLLVYDDRSPHRTYALGQGTVPRPEGLSITTRATQHGTWVALRWSRAVVVAPMYFVSGVRMGLTLSAGAG